MHDDDVWFRPAEPLGWPMAALGLVSGLFAMDFAATLDFVARSLCQRWLDDLLAVVTTSWDERVVMAAMYTLCFGVAGRWVASRLAQGAAPKRCMLVALLAATQTAAVALGILMGGEMWLVLMAVGLPLALACAPIGWLLAHNARWAWRARAGTLLHRSYRQARWIDVATAVVVLLSMYANPIFGNGHLAPDGRSEVALAFVLAAAAAAGTLALAAALRLWRVAALGRQFAGARAAPASALGDAPVFDLGIGDDRACDVARAASAYRDHDRVQAVCIGDIRRARRVVGMSVGRALAVALAGACIALVEYRFAPVFGGVCH